MKRRWVRGEMVREIRGAMEQVVKKRMVNIRDMVVIAACFICFDFGLEEVVQSVISVNPILLSADVSTGQMAWRLFVAVGSLSFVCWESFIFFQRYRYFRSVEKVWR